MPSWKDIKSNVKDKVIRTVDRIPDNVESTKPTGGAGYYTPREKEEYAAQTSNHDADSTTADHGHDVGPHLTFLSHDIF